MNKKVFRQLLALVGFGILFYVVLTNIGSAVGFIKDTVLLLLPLTVGLILAFVLNVPMRGMEKLLNKLLSKIKLKHKPGVQVVRVTSLILIFLCILLILALVMWIVVPQLIESIESIYNLIQEKWPDISAKLGEYGIDTSSANEWLKQLDISMLIDKYFESAANTFVAVFNFATSTVSSLINIVFAIVVAIYVLLSKDTLSMYVKKLAYANLKKKTADNIFYVAHLTDEIYSKFLSGQTVEAVILGLLMMITFSIFRLPYAPVVAIVTAISAYVPYVGAFAACVIAGLLTLLAAPSKLLVCIIVYTVTQFIENQFIYPHVVGGSVGLSSFLTLAAALVGGEIMGLFGMIFFIPLTAVLYRLIRDNTNKKLAIKAENGGVTGIRKKQPPRPEIKENVTHPKVDEKIQKPVNEVKNNKKD